MPKSVCDALTGERFSALLERIDPDPSRAAEKVLRLRRRLDAYFRYNHCSFTDELVDRALDILATRLSNTAVESVERYLMAIAQNLVRKAWARRRRLPLALDEVSDRPAPASDPLRSVEESETRRLRAGCLQQCLDRLPDRSRQLFLDCQTGDKSERAEHKHRWAERLGLSPVALRVRLHRIRSSLEVCVTDCLRKRETAAFPPCSPLENRELE